jgi:2-hydroxyglutarate dehydrogenase
VSLQDLYERGLQNKVPDLRMIDGSEIKSIEPFCRGIKAIHSPHTGIVDWALVTEYYAKDFKAAGGTIFTDFEVKKFGQSSGDGDYPVTIVDAKKRQISAKYVLTCAGLQADKVAAMTGNENPPKIVPFRGEYLLLNPKKAHMVKGNIYPVPDPRFPFLGVHFTVSSDASGLMSRRNEIFSRSQFQPRMDGSIWLGPNAVLAFKREGYKWSDINVLELLDALKYPGENGESE